MQTELHTLHSMKAPVRLSLSGEKGVVVGMSKHVDFGDQYLIRYVAADGRQDEAWFPLSAIEPDEGDA